MKRPVWIVAAVGACTALSIAFAGPILKLRYEGDPVSPVIFPEQSLPLSFSHKNHLTKAGLDCDDCHDKAETSTLSSDSLLPKEEVCADCHDIDRSEPNKKVSGPPANCAACHKGFEVGKKVAPVRIPPPNLRFNHKVHVKKGVACATCHGDFVEGGVNLATTAQLPKMGVCLSCHREKNEASAKCRTCHITGTSGRMQTSFSTGDLKPSGVLRGDAHGPGFRQNHRFVAQNDQAYCQNCHRREYCIECHNGLTKPKDFHQNDYIHLHQIEARRNNPDCSSCHRTQTFCVGCHTRSGVASTGSEFSAPLSGRGGPLFHPEGWVNYAPGGGVDVSRGPNHHAFEAQRNIRQCASCHQESFCMNCHSAQQASIRINPHPRNWAGSARCENLLKKAGRMCLRCHVDLAEVNCLPR